MGNADKSEQEAGSPGGGLKATANANRERDIERVYQLLQTNQPLAAVLDAALSSVEKFEPIPGERCDSPLCPSPVGQQRPAAEEDDAVPFSADPTYSTAGGGAGLAEWTGQSQTKEHPAHTFSPPRPKTLLSLSAIFAVMVGVGCLSRGALPYKADPSDAASILPAGTAAARHPLSPNSEGAPSAPAQAITPQTVSTTVVRTSVEAVARAAEAIRGEIPAPRVDLKPLVQRGDSLLAAGDIASARLFYERAVNAGDAQGALRLGETYDPDFLQRIGPLGIRGDVTMAARWYQRAAELGASEAAILLKATKSK